MSNNRRCSEGDTPHVPAGRDISEQLEHGESSGATEDGGDPPHDPAESDGSEDDGETGDDYVELYNAYCEKCIDEGMSKGNYELGVVSQKKSKRLSTSSKKSKKWMKSKRSGIAFDEHLD